MIAITRTWNPIQGPIDVNPLFPVSAAAAAECFPPDAVPGDPGRPSNNRNGNSLRTATTTAAGPAPSQS